MSDAIYTNPKNMSLLDRVTKTRNAFDYIKYPIDFSLPVYTDENIPATQPTGKVNFPKDGNWKFCEFEEKDAEWAVPLGIATREEEPVFYMINVDFKGYNHPWNTQFDEYFNTIDDEVLADIRERIYQEIENKLNEEMFRSFTTKTMIYGAI